MRRTLPAPQQKISQSRVNRAEAEEPRARDREGVSGNGLAGFPGPFSPIPRSSHADPLHSLQTLSQLPPPSDSTLSLPAFNYTELSSLPDALSASPKSPRTPALNSTLPLSQRLLGSSRRLVGQPLTRSGGPSPFPTAAHPNRTHTTLILCV